HHAQGKGQLRRRIGCRALFLEYVLLYYAPAGAAEARGPHAGTPTTSVQDLLPANHVVLVQPATEAHLGAHRRGYLGIEKGTHFGAKGRFLRCVAEVHRCIDKWMPRALTAIREAVTPDRSVTVFAR